MVCLLGLGTNSQQDLERVDDEGIRILQKDLKALTAGDVYLTPDVSVSSTIVIDKPVTLRGSSKGQPSIFRCTEEITALEIRLVCLLG